MSRAAAVTADELERPRGSLKKFLQVAGGTTEPLGARIEAPLNRIDLIYANLFFFFFCAQIFSPEFGGSTLYIEVIVAVLHPRFWRWVRGINWSKEAVAAGVLFTLAFTVTGGSSSVVKVVFTTISVLYLAFAYESGCFYLFRFLTLSTALALVQWVLSTTHDHVLSQNLGPTHLASLVWGSHATATYTNFYAVIGGITRVSGLSREAGFFAALLIASIPIMMISRRQRSWPRLVVLVLGLAVSVSKMSFVGVPLIAAVWGRKWLNKVPAVIVVAVLFTACDVVVNAHLGYLLDQPHQTYTGRFGGYLLLGDLSVHQWLFGVHSLTSLPSETALLITNVTGYQQTAQAVAGLSGLVVSYGLVTLATWVLFVYTLGGRGAAICVLLLGTVDVTVVTNQNFVTLLYFVALYLIGRTPDDDVASAQASARESHIPAIRGLRRRPRQQSA